MIDGMALISVLIILSGLRGYAELLRNWGATFDRNYTDADRHRINFAAFYLLIPISVALHEFGHAVAIWAFGGQVEDFGFYFFAGWVLPDRAFDPVQETIISVAGPATNVILSAICLITVLLPRRPMRPAYNDLLLEFAGVSIVNALIIYPLLDFATGMNGDFTQMYTEGPEWLTRTILACHVAILASLAITLKTPAFQQKLATLTGRSIPPKGRYSSPVSFSSRGPAPGAHPNVEAVLHEAITRVASGWPYPLQVAIQRNPAGLTAVITWTQGGASRSVSAHIDPSGATYLLGLAQGHERAFPLRSWPPNPTADELVLGLREGMERTGSAGTPRYA